MKFTLKSQHPKSVDCRVIGVFHHNNLSVPMKQLSTQTSQKIQSVLKRDELNGEAGQTVMLHDVPGSQAARILLVGCGNENTLSDQTYHQVIKSSIRALEQTSAKQVSMELLHLPVKDRDIAWKLKQAVLVTKASLYQFNKLKSQKKAPASLKEFIFLHNPTATDKTLTAAIKEATAMAEGVALARDLGNTPSNLCTPTHLANEGKKLAKAFSKITTKILSESDMKKLGMGAFLAVSKGSDEPAKMVVMEYKGSTKKNQAPIVLVGKGITFDSGGISIKPSAAMDEMKYDMCGAASVLGTLKALALLGYAGNVVGILAASENLPGGHATKPGDIVTTLSGQTVEILNTDAEGRLVLCDALTYAKRYKPTYVIDIATLTGAMVVALGNHATGMLTNHDPLGEALMDAGKRIHDRIWPMPLWDDYQSSLDSNFADIANIGDRGAGGITAACFLSRFTKDYHWAHLDIAGTAWKSGKEKNATGRPVPLLVEFLISHLHHRK